MNTDLKNVNEFQLVNATTKEFRQYIYTPDGNYCIGGERVSDFINEVERLIKN